MVELDHRLKQDPSQEEKQSKGINKALFSSFWSFSGDHPPGSPHVQGAAVSGPVCNIR